MSVYDFIIHRASACSLQTNMALLVIILHDELIREKGPCSSQPHVACSVLYLYCRCGINQELCQLAPPPPQWVVIFATVGKRGQQNVCIKIKSKHCRLLLFFFFSPLMPAQTVPCLNLWCLKHSRACQWRQIISCPREMGYLRSSRWTRSLKLNFLCCCLWLHLQCKTSLVACDCDPWY